MIALAVIMEVVNGANKTACSNSEISTLSIKEIQKKQSEAMESNEVHQYKRN